MHLLLRKGELAPAEIADRLGTVGKGLQRPEPDHPVTRRDVVWRPVDRPRLLLHHPPAALRCGPVEIMVKRLKIRVAGAREALPVLGWKQVAHLVKKAQRVGIPG